MTEHSYSADQRAAVYRVIEERRDVRGGFRPDPIPPEVLTRVLAAAHQAPSVGHSQPWRFLVVDDADTRQRAATMADRERLALVTTEKDLARLTGDPHASELVARTTALPVALKVRDPAGFERMVLGALGPRPPAQTR